MSAWDLFLVLYVIPVLGAMCVGTVFLIFYLVFIKARRVDS